MKQVHVFLTIIIGFTFLAGRSNSDKVVLQNKNKKLVYDCNNYTPQVETPEDISILVGAALETAQQAASNQEMVTVSEISGAMSTDDWRKLEETVVRYRCAHRK